MAADMKSKATVVPEDNCEDAPPPYHSNGTSVPYAKPGSSTEAAATAVTIVPGVEVQQAGVRNDEPLSSKYSCANPVMEIIERIARILFILILIAFAGVTIASLVRVSSDNIENSYPDDYDYDDDYDDDNVGISVSFFLTLFFSLSLTCTIGALLCDIPVIIIQFISTKIMNHIAFRTLDIIKWILLSIGFAILFLLIITFRPSDTDYPGPVIIGFLVLCGITIAMGIIMAIWDCSHLMVTSSTRNSRPQQVVTLVPVNSTQPVHVTTAV